MADGVARSHSFPEGQLTSREASATDRTHSVYTATNPVKDRLIERVHHYLRLRFAGGVVAWVTALLEYRAFLAAYRLARACWRFYCPELTS